MPREVYVSTDIEADGPIPGRHSMLSFGSVAFDLDGIELGAFERNLETLPDAVGAPDTMEWWANHPEAWEACRRNTVNPREAMQDYVAWIDGLDGRPVFVAYPAAYDFMFVYWYLMTFVGRSPFSHSALDMKTLAMALMKSSYRDSTKRNMPREWFPTATHSHVAVDDAREQGQLFIAMLRESRGEA